MRLLPFILALCIVSGEGLSQGILKRVKETAQSSAENSVLNKTSETAGGATDKALSKKLFSKKEKSKTKPGSSDTMRDTAGSPVVSGNSGIYAKYDFVPGDEITYFKDFAGESRGEMPFGWNTTGSGAVVAVSNLPGNWLQLHQSSVFLSDNNKPFTENFTLEFDLLFHDFGNGIINYPAFMFGFLASGARTATDNKLLQAPDENFLLSVNAGVINDGNGNSTFQLKSMENRSSYFETGQKAFPAIERMIGKTVHVAIQVQKERFRLWLNSEKLFDVPKAISTRHKLNQLYFEVSDNGYSNEQVGIFITNLKIARGIPDTRHKLIDEGKFTTNGIRFDVNKASIRPESFPVLKEIAGLLKQYPDVQIQIIGHTDGDGSDKSNQELSEKRSAAVKDFLNSEFGVDAARMTTSGKGESQPVADNGTPEGKAKNRRVEFIKIK